MNIKKKSGRVDEQQGEELIEFFIDDTLLHSKRLQRRREDVSHAQRILREVADGPAWRAFLEVEKTMNDRAATEVRLVFNRMLAVFAYAMISTPNGRSRR